MVGCVSWWGNRIVPLPSADVSPSSSQVLLVTRFLQHQQHVSGVRAQQAGQNLGLLLMDFLHFFG